MRKSIKSEYTYEDEFIEMVEDNNYDVNDQFTYMIGIQPENWNDEDTQKAKQYDVDVAGYYVLGNNEGMVVVGTLQDIFDFSDQYFGMGLHPDYVCPVDTFDWEDGEWITGGPEVITGTPYYQQKRERDRADINRIMKNWGVNSSRRPVKSGFDTQSVVNELFDEFPDYIPPNPQLYKKLIYLSGFLYPNLDETELHNKFGKYSCEDWLDELYKFGIEPVMNSRKPIKSSYDEDNVVFRATTRGGRYWVEVTETGTNFDRYEIKQNGSVDYANSTAEVLAKLIKQSGWKEGMFDKIEIDNTGTSLGEQYLQIMKMINKEFGSLYKAPNGSAERQYYFDIIRFIAWNIQSHSSMSIEDMIWKAKDALNKKGITCSRKPIKSGNESFRPGRFNLDITPEQNKFNWAYNSWIGHFVMNNGSVPAYFEGKRWCNENEGLEFYDELCKKYNIYPTGDREKAAFYNALKELGEITSSRKSVKSSYNNDDMLSLKGFFMKSMLSDDEYKAFREFVENSDFANSTWSFEGWKTIYDNWKNGDYVTSSRKPIKSSKAKSHESNIEDGCYRLREQVANSTVDYWIDGEDCIIDVVQKNDTTGNSTTWSFCIDFGTNTVYMIEPHEGTPEKFSDDNNAFSIIRTMLNGGK